MFILRKFIGLIKCFGRRRNRYLLAIAAWTALLLLAMSWSEDVSRVLKPPPPPDQNLNHFRRSTDLKHYLDDIQVLIEPSSPCQGPEVTVIVLVTSTAAHVEQRQAIRSTWGEHQPTFFIMAIQGQEVDEELVDNYIEAKQFGDMIIFDMLDHYQNLTLKTALMLKWTLDRCPQAGHVLKTDDDVVINPWALETLLKDHPHDKLIGYRVNNTKLHRDEYTKWYVPRWLYSYDVIPQYLSGTGYIIKGQYLQAIMDAALRTPLINLEDVYLTYLVAKTALNYELVHDRRLSPFRPWVPLDCAYWNLALFHSLRPHEMISSWARIHRISLQHRQDDNVCAFYESYFKSEIFLYRN